MLYTQFPQLTVPRALDVTGVGKAQARPEKAQEINTGRHRNLLIFVQLLPPGAEFIRVLNFPIHANMPSVEYKLKSIKPS